MERTRAGIRKSARLGASLPLRLLRTRDGNVFIEYAFMAPILFLLMAILFDFGMAVYDSMSLKQAARAGAQYAVQHSSDPEAIRQVAASASGLDPADLTVTAIQFCECPDGTPAVCGTSCPDLSAPRMYIDVSIEEAFAPILPYPSSLAPLTLQGDATLRVR